MKKINFEITRLSNLDFDILLEGETGTGKDLIAVQIHQRGNRSNCPFVPVSISSLNESLIESELFGHEKGAFSGADRQKIGKFEAADKGILYIPEISSLPEIIQLKLLQFMQYKTISRVGQDARKAEIRLDVKLIMATNENLEELVKTGKLRKDFYYRISGTKINVLPLRKRTDDIIVLAKYFIECYSKNFPGKKFELSDASMNLLVKYDWPGNVRELSNCIKNVLSFNTEPLIEPEHFRNILNLKNKFSPEVFTGQAQADIISGFQIAEAEFKKAYFKNLLKLTNNKISEAAEIAGLTPQGLRKALNKLGL
jgi:DNA-binding NtrC family response regulator